VDAHTKFIWFYPIAIKSDVFNVFQQFQVLVERQFSRKIKIVQTDWGGEYCKLNFKKKHRYPPSSHMSTYS
jgi:hypothetical protein